MKKIVLFLFFITTIAHSQIVNIPDANFKNILINANSSNYVAKNLSDAFFKIDANDDGEIQYSEALQVSYLQLYNTNISSVIGIEYFTNLINLQCSYNNINDVDLLSLVNIQTINLSYNNLNQINTNTLINLTSLSCSNNNITSVDLTNNSNLLNIDFDSNNLQTLDISNLNQLTVLTCNNNMLVNIDLPTATNLQSINCSNNLLTNMNFSNYVNLTSINCFNNNFTSNDFSNLPNLNSLVCGGFSLNSLNLNNLSGLSSLHIYNGIFTQLDINSLIQLSILEVYNCDNISQLDISNLVNITNLNVTFCANLQSLDMSNNQNLFVVRINSNNGLQNVNLKNGSIQDIDGMFFDTSLPNLSYFCADENEISILQSELNYFYYNNTISVNSYCSFTPGGSFNTVSGVTQFDINSNGCDVNDIPMQFLSFGVNLDAVSTNSSVYTNNLGNYSLFTSQNGTYGLTPNFENPNYFTINPNPAVVNIPVIDDSTTTQNFCITANGVHPDLEIVIAPIIPARPGFDAVYKIVYKNKGNQTVDGYVNFTYNETLLDLISSSVAPTNAGSGMMNWFMPGLVPFQSGSIIITLNVNSPQETPAVNIGDILTFNAFIDVTTDDNWNDNNFDFNQTVVGSFDPNDITCIEGDVVAPSYIGEYLHYVINFENTGTAAAENVVVKIEVNPNDFDINTLRILESSHNATIKITNNILEIIFQTIMLDTGGHGNVLLKVKSRENLILNDIVSNNAKIYFDYNFPILTNDANTTFQVLSNSILTKDVAINLYPNPTSSLVNIKAENTIKSTELYDVQGRLIQINKSDSNEVVLDISIYNLGIYFIKVTTDFGSQIKKIVKE
ncbi:MAG: T9SS type A sorting domain-containing protein [Flavobacterium sp.]|nr:T9SS type A sorting domain-containing protein [Flavobacterium sp.]